MGGRPDQSVFQRQRPVRCNKCGYVGAPHPVKFGCVDTCPHDEPTPPSGTPPTPPTTPPGRETVAVTDFTAKPGRGGVPSNVPHNPGNHNGARKMDQAAHPNRPGWRSQSWPWQGEACPPSGAPYPFMDPRNPSKVYGCELPCDKIGCATMDEAARQLCWLETTIRSPAVVPAGVSIAFSIEVKWWWQIQKVQNLGDQVAATFELVDIAYGQSNYNLEIRELLIDDVAVAQNGIDVRRWNQGLFSDKFYPFPATGLNDPVVLTFTNVSALAADITLLLGGPGVLQIG